MSYIQAGKQSRYTVRLDSIAIFSFNALGYFVSFLFFLLKIISYLMATRQLVCGRSKISTAKNTAQLREYYVCFSGF